MRLLISERKTDHTIEMNSSQKDHSNTVCIGSSSFSKFCALVTQTGRRNHAAWMIHNWHHKHAVRHIWVVTRSWPFQRMGGKERAGGVKNQKSGFSHPLISHQALQKRFDHTRQVKTRVQTKPSEDQAFSIDDSQDGSEYTFSFMESANNRMGPKRTFHDLPTFLIQRQR